MKRIITCSDGTWNKPDQKDDGIISPSNVSKIYDLISDEGIDDVLQKHFYYEGVGTDWYNSITGGLFGMGINKNIIDAYKDIASNYDPGDEIYLFGFSRGAYTARSIAGFIRNSGLLKKEFLNDNLKYAFELYKSRDDSSNPESDEAKDFRNAYCYDNVRIKFIGVWDTVGELGIPVEIFDNINTDVLNCRFYDVQLSSYVDYAYHALAVDEHRKPFLPTLWEQKESAKKDGQVMEQVWFAGAHSDVGGGYSESGLSNCTLRWMIEKAKSVGLQFEDYKKYDPNPLDVLHNSMKPYYEILGSVNRKIGNGKEYYESVSQTVIARHNANIDNYQKITNPNIKSFIPTPSLV